VNASLRYNVLACMLSPPYHAVHERGLFKCGTLSGSLYKGDPCFYKAIFSINTPALRWDMVCMSISLSIFPLGLSVCILFLFNISSWNLHSFFVGHSRILFHPGVCSLIWKCVLYRGCISHPANSSTDFQSAHVAGFLIFFNFGENYKLLNSQFGRNI
jgi:hypothetical protein